MDHSAEAQNLLDSTPVHNVEWEENRDTGLIVLKKPKFKNAILKKYLLPKLKSPFYSIKLDKIGSFVWSRIDGRNSISVIAKDLEQEFGESVQPVDQRLAKFIYSLHRNSFIILKRGEST